MRVFLFTFLFAISFSVVPAGADFAPTDDPIVVSRITGAIASLEKQFPELHSVTLKSGQLDIGVYAVTQDDTITFNSVYTQSPKVLERMITENSSTGFHPALGNCTPEQWLAYHEATHVLDHRRADVPSTTLGIRYGHMHGLPLSDYSFPNGELFPIEALAEAVSSVLCNGGNPIERQMFKLLEES